MESGSTWTPVLNGELRAAAEDVITHIAEVLVTDAAGTHTSLTRTLAGGLAGIAVALDYMEQAGLVESYLLRNSHIANLAQALSATPLPVGFHDGFTGIAWAIGQLDSKFSEQQAFTEIDAALIDYLRLGKPRQFDVISGLSGIAVYAASRPDATAFAMLNLIAARLEELADVTEAGVAWPSKREDIAPPWRHLYPPDYYNLGPAHGAPGPLLAFALAARFGVTRASDLLERTMSRLESYGIVNGEARFPYWVSRFDAPRPAGLSWCYGDLGIACVLLAIDQISARPHLYATALELAKRAAVRTDYSTADASFCHGSSGVAHLFNRLWQRTRDRTFLAAAQDWFSRALALYRADAPEPYLSWRDGEWVADHGLLAGIAGVGAAFAAACAKLEPTWDAAFLLRLPERRVAQSQ